MMSSALNLHNEVLRDMIREYNGYEIRTQGDSFVLAFENPQLATKFCMQSQIALHETEWDTAFMAMHPSVNFVEDSEKRKVFSGLRVRMGIHTGVPDFYQPDKISGRMGKCLTFGLFKGLFVLMDFSTDYFGPAMNLAGMHEICASVVVIKLSHCLARVGSMPLGGQVIVSGNVWEGLYRL
jgi:hypothetical protein